MPNFIKVNKIICDKIAWGFPQARSSIFTLYEEVVGQYLNAKPEQIVVDMGGGKSCPFARFKDNQNNNKIIGLDVSLEELLNNSEVDERIVGNIISEIPLRDNSVDLTVSRSVIEHLTNVERFITSSHRILKNAGYMIHLFPSKFALFAIINQILPRKLSKKILNYLRPQTKGICGFPAFYDRCYYSGILHLLQQHNFEPVDIRISYYQASYYDFLAPLFLLVGLYEMIIYLLRWKNLGAYVLVVAQKQEQ